MAIANAPTRRTYSGIVYSIQGKPYQRRTVIRPLVQGRYARTLRYERRLIRQLVGMIRDDLKRNAPVDTGKLKASIHASVIGRGPIVVLGPQPYNRARLKAQQAGRVYKRRKPNPKKSKFYGIPANVRSRQPQYIDRSLRNASRRAVRIINNVERIRQNEIRLGAGRR
ncbi:MAG: hypothetical protein OXQ29_17765 [Rhodospirillaceae bacterium]|nr:hypothetical protein [Rhodospirillaceae bacterium]